MNAPHYVDLLVIDGAWQLDAGGQPRLTQDLHSVAQDCKHRLMASGLARTLVGERSPTLCRDVMTDIALRVERDVRLIPGTVLIDEFSAGQYRLTARAYEMGELEVVL